MYIRFTKTDLSRDEMLRYIGVYLLLSLSSTKNYKKAWNKKSSQFVVYLLSLMSRNRFEAINAFFHIVTPQEELANANDPLRKVKTFYDVVKAKCLELYQPLQQLSVDERMVKSKARTHFRQFIRNKPTKWGFKFWVLADSTGYTSDCDLY